MENQNSFTMSLICVWDLLVSGLFCFGVRMERDTALRVVRRVWGVARAATRNGGDGFNFADSRGRPVKICFQGSFFLRYLISIVHSCHSQTTTLPCASAYFRLLRLDLKPPIVVVQYPVIAEDSLALQPQYFSQCLRTRRPPVIILCLRCRLPEAQVVLR